MLKKTLPLLLIFLIALIFRTYGLTDIPPGLTHDEANHGREAIGILAGDLRFYFPANYGSEPVYSYTTALSMLLLGENLLALRLVNVFFGLGAMGVAYVWAVRAFDRRVALLALGVTAVTFWPVATSREALRAGMLPLFMALAVWFLWQIVFGGKVTRWQSGKVGRQHIAVLAFAVSIAITLHIYLAARVAWLIFPVFLIYLALVHRDRFKAAWQPVLMGLGLAGLLVVPMFVYLNNHPEAQTRLSMLDGTLQGLLAGDFLPVLQNGSEALLAFIWPGFGDQFLAYNIPGRPVFDGVTAVFFTIGLLISIWRWKQPNYALLLFWFGIGIIPSLLTGATANTTRNLAALPAVMLLPAVGFTAVAGRFLGRLGAKKSSISNLQSPAFILAVVWLGFAGFITARDYFVRWAQLPDVRGAYQVNLVAGLEFLEAERLEPPLVISTVYPGAAHDPSIALVLSPEVSADAHWVDTRYGLVFPDGGNGRILIPASTPIHPALAEFVEEVTAVSLRPDDLDPSFALYQLDPGPLAQWPEIKPVNFDNAITLRAAHWLADTAHPGDVVELVTVWEVTDPARVGPLALPFYTTDAVMFTQVIDDGGQVMTQRDALDAPSWDWQAGDVIVQVHPLGVPAEVAPGSYRTIVGLYDKLSGERRPVVAADGTILDTFADVPPLQITAR